MSNEFKINRNDPCPCLTGKKFKRCCSGKVDWETILREGRDYRTFLSVRGRNLYFSNRISEALQLDVAGRPLSLREYKAAFTPDAVRKIHEAAMEVWPPNTNIHQVLGRSAEDVSGLYIGDYSADYIIRGIVRHSIYANKIILFDPFIYPSSVADEYNPILNPKQHRAQTLKNVNLWFSLLPWIVEGIVEIIRPPADFDRTLNWKLMNDQMRKFNQNKELKAASDSSVDELSERHTQKVMYQQLLLGAPDSHLERKFEELGLGKGGLKKEDFLKSVQEDRDRDPDFLEPMDPNGDSQFFTFSSGASYPSATMTARLTGSYLFTDIYLKWKEIELDRENHSAENKVWSPFAKALQDSPLRYLNNLQLDHAL